MIMDPVSFVSHTTCMHGIDASQIEISHDEVNGATYLYLDRDSNVSIRIRMNSEWLEINRKGLRALSKAATQIAQEIEKLQATGAIMGDGPAASGGAAGPSRETP